MTNNIDFFRGLKKMRLALAFCVSASALHPPAIETPQQQELRMLAQAYDRQGIKMDTARFERMVELLKSEKNPAKVLAGTAICAHGNAGSTAPGGTTTSGIACHTTRRKKGDMSHLLAIDHLSYYM